MSIWLKRFAILCLFGFPAALLGTRLGLFEFRLGFGIVSITFFASAVIVLAGLVVALMLRKKDAESAKTARSAVLISLLPFLGIGLILVGAKSVPAIHNISTDVNNPPQFDKIASIRTNKHNPLSYDAEALAGIQQAAYPTVKTLLSKRSLGDAHARAKELVLSYGWKLVADNPQTNVIEATVTTALWAFKDDVVIRLSSSGEFTAIDLRSVSRVGQSDLGANARRISTFLEDFDN